MLIEKVRFQNFKSFWGEHEIEFRNPKLRGLFHLRGPIGSGKTTIGEVILFGLFGEISGKNLKTLITRGEKHALVEIWVVSREKHIHIKREINLNGQSPIEVVVDSIPLIFTNKIDAQRQLEKEYLDISQESAEQLCIISFNSFRSLSTMSTKETRAFLERILGLEKVFLYADTSKEIANEARKRSQLLRTKLDIEKRQLERIKALNKPLEENPDTLKTRIDELKESLRSEECALNSELFPILSSISDLKSKLSEVKVLGKRTANDIARMKMGVCPQCGSPIDQSHLSEKIEEREGFLQKYKCVLGKIEEMEAQKNVVESENRNITKTLREELSNLQLKYGKITEQLRQRGEIKSSLDDVHDIIESLGAELDTETRTEYEFTELNEVFMKSVLPNIINNFVPCINDCSRRLAAILGHPFIPTYNHDFGCDILLDDNTPVPISSLSTGQLKVVDTIIILSVLTTIVSCSRCNVILLDELFSNLDAESAEKMVEVIRSVVPPNTTVFLVSHAPIPESLLDGIVSIERDEGGRSKIKVEI